MLIPSFDDKKLSSSSMCVSRDQCSSSPVNQRFWGERMSVKSVKGSLQDSVVLRRFILIAALVLLVVGIWNLLSQSIHQGIVEAGFYPDSAFKIVDNTIQPIKQIPGFEAAIKLDTGYILAYLIAFVLFGFRQTNFNPWGYLTIWCAILSALMDFVENEMLRGLYGFKPLLPVPTLFGLIPSAQLQLDLLQSCSILKYFLAARAVSSASTMLFGEQALSLWTRGFLTISAWILTGVSLANMFKSVQGTLHGASMVLLFVSHVGLIIGLIIAFYRFLRGQPFARQQPLSQLEVST